MTRISLTNDLFGDFEVGDGRLMGVYGPSLHQGAGLDDEALRERIRNPIGTPSLREISKGVEKVLIVTDDNTRHTPLHRVVPIVLDELAEMGYRFQFITLAGWHVVNHHTFELARAYDAEGMAAYSRLQNREFASEVHGYTATRHQAEVGAGYFDRVMQVVTGGEASTLALAGSTEVMQFA